jgi:L-rhamnose isomerase
MFADIRHELEEAAKLMPGPQKINMMLVDFSTPEFRAFVTQGKESDT